MLYNAWSAGSNPFVSPIYSTDYGLRESAQDRHFVSRCLENVT